MRAVGGCRLITSTWSATKLFFRWRRRSWRPQVNRTRGTQGNHANAFYAVAAFRIEGLEEVNIRTEHIRQTRRLSAYEPDSPAPEQLRRPRDLLDSSLPARLWLAGARPGAQLTRDEE
jgi:hypothetical protein